MTGAGSVHLRRAARVVAAGGLIAYPTEAVYGLGCDPRNGEAVRRLLAVKQRPENKGMILIAADFEQLVPFVEEVGPESMAAVHQSWPGPFTWLLPARPSTPPWLRGDHETLAVRVTAHPLAAALCRCCGTALVSTSANRSNQPPARTATEVRAHLGADLDFLVPGDCGPESRPSQICDARTGRLLRA